MPRLLTWNVAGRVRNRLEAQLAVVGEQAWDAVCLQEVTPTTRDRWETALGDLGYHVAISPWLVAPKGLRRLTRRATGPGCTRRAPSAGAWTTSCAHPGCAR